MKLRSITRAAETDEAAIEAVTTLDDETYGRVLAALGRDAAPLPDDVPADAVSAFLVLWDGVDTSALVAGVQRTLARLAQSWLADRQASQLLQEVAARQQAEEEKRRKEEEARLAAEELEAKRAAEAARERRVDDFRKFLEECTGPCYRRIDLEGTPLDDLAAAYADYTGAEVPADFRALLEAVGKGPVWVVDSYRVHVDLKRRESWGPEKAPFDPCPVRADSWAATSREPFRPRHQPGDTYHHGLGRWASVGEVSAFSNAHAITREPISTARLDPVPLSQSAEQSPDPTRARMFSGSRSWPVSATTVKAEEPAEAPLPPAA